MTTPARLGNLSIDDFINTPIQTIDTWPYEPSGLLSQHSGPNANTNQLMQEYNDDWNETERFVEHFSDKQRAALGWFFAALIGVFGNLAVSLGFSLPVVGVNLWWVFLTLIIVAILIGLYLLYLPKVSLVFRFIPKHVNFPSGYEQHVNRSSCTNPFSASIFQYNRLRELVTQFGVIVRLAILKDELLDASTKASCVRISNIRKADEHIPVVYVEISTKGITPWFNPKASNKIQKELRDFVQAMSNARESCAARDFEADPTIWNQRGCGFIDATSDWDAKQVQNMIINLLKNESPDDQ